MLFLLAVAVCIAVGATAQSTYFLGALGQSCTQICYAQGMNCNPAIIEALNISAILSPLGMYCAGDPAPWFGADQPSFWPTGSGGGWCYGVRDVPDAVPCSGAVSPHSAFADVMHRERRRWRWYESVECFRHYNRTVYI